MSTWNLDLSHSTLGFTVRHLMVTKVHGRFAKATASFDDVASTARAEIDVASIDTREEKRDAHLRSADFFDVEKFPTITFESTEVSGAKGDAFVLNGRLTIHGVTRDVHLEVERLGVAKDPWGNEKVSFEAKTHISRKDFGMTWNVGLEAGGVLVSDRVDITLDLQFVKQLLRARRVSRRPQLAVQPISRAHVVGVALLLLMHALEPTQPRVGGDL